MENIKNKDPFQQRRLYQFIILLAGILIAGSALIFLQDFRNQTESTERELLGVKFVEKLQATMFEAQRARGLFEVIRQGDIGAKPPYLEARKRLQEKFKLAIQDSYGIEVGLSSRLLQLQRDMLSLMDELSQDPAPDSFKLITNYIEIFRDLLLHTASLSYLANDTDVTTYYLADLSTNHLPSVVEAIGRLRGIGAGIIASGKYQKDELVILEREIQTIYLELSHVDRKLRSIFKIKPELKPILSTRFSHINTNVDNFTSYARHIINSGYSEVDALSYFNRGTVAANVCETLCGSLRGMLKEMLDIRIHKLKQRSILVGTGLISAILLLIILAFVFYHREHQLISQLVDETKFSSALVDGLPGLFFLLDKHGKLHRWNHELERISGYKSMELRRLSAADLLITDQRELITNNIESISEVVPIKGELSMLTKSSSVIPLYATGLSVKLAGKPYVVGFAVDITERKKMEKRLEKMAETDGLTGIYNRSKFNSDIKHVEEKALRYDRGFSLIAIDIDHFKNINDTHGHGPGDVVMKEMVHIINSQIRQLDSFYRYGGEEFHVILPETDFDGARLQAERLRMAVEEFTFTLVGKVTISLGIAEYIMGEDIDALLKRADDSLYAAKMGGRNRVDG